MEVIMMISDIRIRMIKRAEGRLKAVASIIIDNVFAIHDIKILERTDGYFIAMPSRKTPDGEYKDIAHPINSETRELLSDLILKSFRAELENPREV